MANIKMDSVIVFEVNQEEDGGFVAECLTEDIFTQGDSWEELRINVSEAVKGYYFDQAYCPTVKLHLVKEETLVIQ
ncbi:MAG: type II toxin-antitoxin system HicB family antitoxin [Halothece sp.]